MAAPFRLLDLPPELRLMVYDHLVPLAIELDIHPLDGIRYTGTGFPIPFLDQLERERDDGVPIQCEIRTSSPQSGVSAFHSVAATDWTHSDPRMNDIVPLLQSCRLLHDEIGHVLYKRLYVISLDLSAVIHFMRSRRSIIANIKDVGVSPPNPWVIGMSDTSVAHLSRWLKLLVQHLPALQRLRCSLKGWPMTCLTPHQASPQELAFYRGILRASRDLKHVWHKYVIRGSSKYTLDSFIFTSETKSPGVIIQPSPDQCPVEFFKLADVYRNTDTRLGFFRTLDESSHRDSESSCSL